MLLVVYTTVFILFAEPSGRAAASEGEQSDDRGLRGGRLPGCHPALRQRPAQALQPALHRDVRPGDSGGQNRLLHLYGGRHGRAGPVRSAHTLLLTHACAADIFHNGHVSSIARL